MEAPVHPGEAVLEGRLEGLLEAALVLDLEVSPQGRLFKLGAVLGDRTLVLEGKAAANPVHPGLQSLVRNARCLLGHNLRRHDLAVLRESVPRHPLLRLPVIDTLVLSPIAFPENPYHRLVKDYKLVSESLNDPIADARQAAVLFRDEFYSLAGLRETEPALFELLHFLLATPDTRADPGSTGLEHVFQAIGGRRPDRRRALAICAELFRRWGCASVPAEASLTRTGAGREALAYALTWLRVAGSGSVLPPWVRLEHPQTQVLIRRLRELPCTAPDCAYCRTVHDARTQLHRFFNLEDFRAQPANRRGGSLQRDIVEAGLRDESLLAILPTGAGKSLCYQLPALVRNYRRGVLTLVISPLQALMKDQVDGLVRRTGTPFAAALFGLLTPPERADVLRRVRLGDLALLYVSPEQLRNRSFREAIAQREVGCWVFDEAHCLSKWGHDFRPDYLYAGRFIREFSKRQGGEVPSVACFTATARRDVREEIVGFFKTELNRDLTRFEGGVERNNLHFEVQTITAHAKLERLDDLLRLHLDPRQSGSAIVFRATRADTRESAEFLAAKGWRADHFHAGLTPPEKKRVQDEFLDGTLQVICATNAFGMGIDKEDIRLVIHADTPGSLENYLQEAGRAGRDGRQARCILLHADEDCEQQFRLGAFSELSRRDIAQILRALRRAAHGNRSEIVITTGEILRDEDIQTGIRLEDTHADTQVRTAIAWLERAGFLERDENVTSVFQARPLVRDLAEAEVRLATLDLSATERALWLAVLRELMNAGPGDHLTVDQLALLPEFVAHCRPGGSADPDTPRLQEPAVAYGERANPDYVSAKILRILRNMAQVGLIKRDTLLNAFVRHQVADGSRQRLDRLLVIDRKMVDLLSLEEPDPEGWMPLSLRLLNQRLLDEGLDSSTRLVFQLLDSLSQDGRGFAGSHGSLDLRQLARDTYSVRIRRSWTALSELAEKRRRVASLALEVLLGKIPAETPASASLLVEFSFDDLHQAIDRDVGLRSTLKDPDAALERALMYLHEHRIIVLQQGLAIFRSAMTLRLQPDNRGRKYTSSDYQPLEHHYRERTFQVHVMSEYARRGLARIREALHLVLAYFSLDKESFIRRFLGAKPELLEHATTARSFQRIVTDLANPAQIRIVTAPVDRNLLILAGPGAGKTRTVVHRCAHLLRVQRVRPNRILICCFNRQAAMELRRRLRDLVGPDARGVAVLTYHALALRLLGQSCAAANSHPETGPDFDSLIPRAVELLRGETIPAGIEPDELRDRLLAGFEHILVDEYQDIDEPQYQLISALAGRTLDDPDLKLSILAVGDDDQSIYGFRGANVEFIRRFHQDYDAEVHYLVDNHRATRYLIEAANCCIAANHDRMKSEHPIQIDRHRGLLPPGGLFGQQDALTGGRVQIVLVRDDRHQAGAVLAELDRLRSLGVSPSNIAVLSRSHRELAQVRFLAERHGLAVRWWPDRHQLPPLHQVRELHRFLDHLATRRAQAGRATAWLECAATRPHPNRDNPWQSFLERLLEAWRDETDDAELPAQALLEFLYEACAEGRREFSCGHGVHLSTIHAAKGTEHDHVLLIGAWPLDADPKTREERRRLFYVGMTRARHSLAIFDRADVHPAIPGTLEGAPFLRRDADPDPADPPPAVHYVALGLDDIHLGYPATFPADHPIHAALTALQPGHPLTFEADVRGLHLLDARGVGVARLSRKAEAVWRPRLDAVREIRVVALVRRTADPTAAPASSPGRVTHWEIPLVEIIAHVAAVQTEVNPVGGNHDDDFHDPA